MAVEETNSQVAAGSAGNIPAPDEARSLSQKTLELSPGDAAALLAKQPDEMVVAVLEQINPSRGQRILACFETGRRDRLIAAATPDTRKQWALNESYDENTVGRVMEPPMAVFAPTMTVAEATERLRTLVKRALITYIFVADESSKLLGVVAMREMLLAGPTQTLQEIMLPNPFHLTPGMPFADAMKATVTRHFPVYPVCEADGKIVGLVRGQMLFEAQAFELSAVPGTMVGVEKEERLSTHWSRSLRFRHPWLQLNLLTAFVAAAVVGVFEETIDKIVVLAVFLPVLAGQSGNTGCQALAVTLRGLTLGELTPDKVSKLISKEALLGLCNGFLVGVTAGIGMYVYAMMQGYASAAALGGIVMLAMMCSCVVSGISGALVPLTLKRLGADPATASSIFLTTATDVVSMGCFLGLATLLLTK